MTTKPPTFGGEVQFAGYSDSSRSGPRITFRLADRDELAAFIGKEGKRYMLAVVEIADDETPSPAPAPRSYADSYVDLQNPGRSSEDVRREVQQRERRQRMAPLCEWAVMRCAEKPFQRWCNDMMMAGRVPPAGREMTEEQYAKHVICHLCGIESRKDLDTTPHAARRLHDLVRKPYAAWLEQQQVPA